jgi:hypothetical protein
MQLEETRIVGRRIVARGRSGQGGGVVHGRSPFPPIIIAAEQGARVCPRRAQSCRWSPLPAADAQKWLNDGRANTSC